MRLKSLKISGFKSFAKPVVLDFSGRVSAIVGPNGSGKSNVSESIAWVLGEQSIKNLRGKKGEDLIFNGSPSISKLGKASVSLVFSRGANNSEGDFLISRSVFRNGENEYFIDNTRSLLKDAVEFLNKEGAGALKHHIIRQGEADNVLNASLKERREIIENALGLKIFKIKKEDSERKLEKTEVNINQIESLRNEIQPHLKFLKKQVKKADESLELKEKLKKACSVYFSKAEKFFREKNLALKFEENKLKEKIFEKEKNVSEIKKSVEKFANGNKENGDLRDRISEIEREMGRCEVLIEQAKKRSEDKTRIDNKEKIFIFSATAEEVKKFAEFLEEKINRAFLAGEISEVKKILSEMKNKVAEFLKKDSPKKEEKEEKEIFDGKNILKELSEKYNQLADALKKAKKEDDEFQKKDENFLKAEREFYREESFLNEAKNELRAFEIKKNEFEFRKENILKDKEEAEIILREKIILLESDGDFDFDKNENERREIEKLKIKFEESGGIGEEIIKEYEEIRSRDEFLISEISDLKKTSESLKKLIKQLEEKLNGDFESGILKINKEFQKFFESMFGGGKAELKIKKEKKEEQIESELGEEILSEEKDETEKKKILSGVDVFISLPRKKVGSLEMLSGGERALTSIALLFAISQVNPPPFLILDETDAALDESNSRKYASMLKKLSEKTQLILITHNRETMSIADILYGVTMGGDGASRLLSIKLEEAEGIVV